MTEDRRSSGRRLYTISDESILRRWKKALEERFIEPMYRDEERLAIGREIVKVTQESLAIQISRQSAKLTDAWIPIRLPTDPEKPSSSALPRLRQPVLIWVPEGRGTSLKCCKVAARTGTHATWDWHLLHHPRGSHLPPSEAKFWRPIQPPTATTYTPSHRWSPTTTPKTP